MTLTRKPSKLVPQQFPDFVHEYGPDFIAFVQAFYEWMELQGNPVHLAMSWQDQKDVDKCTDEFFEYFHDTYMRGFPHDIMADRRLVIKHIREQLYRAKGTERGYKFLFRILYNEDVEFYYPGKDILRASDGKWQIDRSLTFTELFISPIQLSDFKGDVLEGMTSGAMALFERSIETITGGVTTYQIFLNPIKGDFLDGEYVRCRTCGTLLFKNDTYTIHPGRWLNTDGFLSSNKYLQDNFYYQDFSYVLMLGHSFSKYEKIIKQFMHPAGTLAFGQFVSRVTLDARATMNFDIVEIECELGLESEANASGFDLTIEADTDNWVFGPELNGTVATAYIPNIGELQNETIGSFAGWTIGHLTNGKGWIGTNTTFGVDLASNSYIYVKNLDTDEISLHTVEDVQSDTRFTTTTPYPYGVLTQGKIRVGTPVSNN